MANLEELKNKYNELHKETGKTSNTVSTGSVLEKLKTRYNELQPEKKEEIKEKEPLISPENTELLKKFNPLIPEKRDPTDYMGLNLQMVPVEKPEPTFKQYTGPGIVDRQEEPLWRKVAKWALPEQLEKVAGLDQPMEEKTIKQRMMEIEDANQVYYRDKKFQEVLTKEIKENPKIPDDYKEPDSFVGQVIEGVESGWKGTVVPSIGYFAESTGIKIGSPDMIKWGQEFGDKMIVEFLKQPELAAPSDMKGLFDGGAGDPRAYGRIIGETIPFMGTVVSLAIAGGLIGGPFGAGAAGLGSVAVIEQGNAYKAMLDAKVAPDKAAEASAIYGAVAAIIENMFGYLPGKVAANILSPTRVATNSVKSYLLKELPKMAGRAAKKSLEEGGEEVAQQIAQDLLSGWAGSEEGMSTFKELAEQFAAGAIGSLPFGVTEFRAPQFPEETKTETKSFYIPADVAPDKVKVEPEVEVPKVELPKAKEVKKETAIEEPVAVQEAEGTTPNAIILPGSTKVRMGEGVFAKSTIDGNKITKENKKVSYSVMNGMNEGKLLISRIETQLREQNVPENDIKSIMSRIPMVENQTYTDNMFDAITAHNDSVKELSETKEIKKEFTGEEIAKEAKKLGTDQDFSEHSLDQIAKENYKTKIISIKQLVETDKDLDEYLKTSKIREFEGEPFAMNPIVSSSGEVLDGYNRIAQAIANEESTIDVLYGIKKEVKEKETSKGKSFEEAFETDEKGKVDIMSLLNFLDGSIKQEDKSLIKVAKDAVNDTLQDKKTRELAIKSVKDKGYEDYAYFLEYIDNGYSDIKISDGYKAELEKQVLKSKLTQKEKVAEVIKEEPKTIKKPEKEKKVMPKKVTPKKVSKKPIKIEKQISNDKAIKAIIGKKTPSVPIIENFVVRDGVMFATDLEIGISLKTDLDNGVYKFVGKEAVKQNYNIEDFPVLPDVKGKKILSLSATEIANEFKKASLAVSKNMVRPEIAGVFLESKDGKISIVSTDSFRLFYKTIGGKSFEDTSFILGTPDKLYKSILALGEKISVYKEGVFIKFSGSNGDIIMKETEVTYPDIKVVMPSFSERYSLNKDEALKAFKELKPFVKEFELLKTSEIYLEFKEDKLILTVKEEKKEEPRKKVIEIDINKTEEVNTVPNVMNDGNIVMPILANVENNIAININYLIDAFNSIEGDTVYFYKTESNRSPSFISDEILDEEEIVKKKSKRISGFDIFNLSLEEAAIKHGELFDKEEIRFGIENKFDDDGTLGEYRKQRSLIYKDEYIRMILLLKKNNKTSEDVLYHEAFHAFFDTFISKVERNRALNIAKKNVPAKIASMVYSKKDYKTPEARAEELIADDFARYVANKKGVKYIGLRWLYEKIMNKLTSWVRKEAKLEKIYNDILNKKRRKGVKIDVTQREAVRSKKGVDKKVNKNIYYHGTNVQFEEFNPNANPEDYGTWFANNRKEIDDIKMKYVFEVELKPNVKLVSERKWDRIINMRKYEDLSYIEMIKETEARGIKYDNGDIQLFYPEEDLINKQTEPEFQEIEEDIIKSKKSFGKKRQAKLISGSPGASIGKFRDGTEIKLGHLDKVKAIEFPELVELAKELMGVVPSVAKMMEHKHGMFYSLERGRIKLNMDLFKQENYKQLVATLAHEIGHLIDYLPNRTLKRGNLLGRLFTLRGFLKSTFGSEGSLDLKKSGAIRNSEISAELKGVSEYWRPYDKEESTASFSAYRNSSKELYADTISMLFNDPKKLKEMAPIFYEQFFENLDRKPDVKNAYFDIQELLSHDRATLIKLRRERTREMFDRADYKAEELQRVKEAEKAVKANDYWERFTYTIRSINQPIYDKVNKIEKEGAHIPDDENPKYLLSGRNYLAGRIKAEFEDNIKPIMVNLERNGIDWKTFGEFLLYERVAEGDRSEFANPGGITPKDAKERIETLKVYYGDRYEVLVKNGKSFREFLKDVSKDAYDAELFSNELFEKFKENDKYAPFQVVEYMDNYVAWKTKTQVGTLKDVNNPANSLILKTISIIKATENQKNKVATFNFLEEYFPNEIEEAKMVYTGKGRVPVESRDKSLALSTYYEDGKLRGKYIDKYIAKSLEKDSISRNRAVMTVLSPLSYLNQKLFRPLFVIYNPGWIPFNFIRDFLRFWKNTPDLSFAGAIKRYGQAFRASRVRVYGAKEGSAEDAEALALIRKLEKEKVLNVTWNDILDGQTEEDAQIEGVMQKLGLAESKKEISSIYKPFEKIFRKTKLTKVLQGIRQVGDVIETMPKIAGYYELNGKMAPNKMGEFIRKNIGSPDFLEKGWATPATNNIFLFSNAFIQAITADSYIATNPTTRSGFWMKTAKMTYLPKILMFAALMGAFGDDLKELYEDVSEYDMTNYFIIPVGKDTNNGKTIYIRIPMDETSRLLGAVLWKLMRTGTNKQGIGKDIGDVVSLFGGQLPSVTPALSAPFAAFQFAAGQNPYDSFRGRQVLTDDQMKAGGMYALKPFLLWEFQQVGGGIFFKFYAGEQTPRQKSPGEKFLEVPLVSNVVGRFIKISDYGQLEKYWAEIDVIKAEKSRERLDENRIINSYVEKHQNNEGEYGELVNDLVLEVLGHKISSREEKTKANNLKKKFRVSIERGKSDPEINALISSSTNEEKVTLMKVYKETMSEPKFDELKKELLKYKIISGNVIRELNKAFKP